MEDKENEETKYAGRFNFFEFIYIEMDFTKALKSSYDKLIAIRHVGIKKKSFFRVLGFLKYFENYAWNIYFKL